MFLDFKIAEEREENGLIYQRVRFYQGDMVTEMVPIDLDGNMAELTYYKRSSLLEEVEYWYE